MGSKVLFPKILVVVFVLCDDVGVVDPERSVREKCDRRWKCGVGLSTSFSDGERTHNLNPADYSSRAKSIKSKS